MNVLILFVSLIIRSNHQKITPGQIFFHKKAAQKIWAAFDKNFTAYGRGGSGGGGGCLGKRMLTPALARAL